MIWVTVEDVIAVHSRIIKASGGLDGIRDRNSLEAAVNAPLQTFAGFDLFETDLAKIARIGFGLASNHAFLDGNLFYRSYTGDADSVFVRAHNLNVA